MKKIKITTYIMLAGILALQLSYVTQASTVTAILGGEASALSDIMGHKYQTAIEFLERFNVIHGHPDKTFRPDTELNRAEALKLLFLTRAEAILKAETKCFPDLDIEAWYIDFICAASAQGWLHGYPDGNFRPGRSLNKVEALKLVGNMLEWDLEAAANSSVYADTPLTEWYIPYVRFARMANLIDVGNNTLEPGAYISRGVMAELIFRTIALAHLDATVYTSATAKQFLEAVAAAVAGTGFTLGGGSAAMTGACSDKEAAKDYFIANFVNNDANRNAMDAFQYDFILTSGDTFTGFSGSGTAQKQTVESGEPSWLFWVDYGPKARFMHPTKLATVATLDCTIKIYDSQLWPVIKGQAVWSTDLERSQTNDRIFRGSLVTPAVSTDFPDMPEEPFGTCLADPGKRKVATLVWLGEDIGIRRDAMNVYKFLCDNDYVTTTITGNDTAAVTAAIETNIEQNAAASRSSGGWNNFFFYTVSHGMKNGDLFVSVDAAGVNAVTLDDITAKMGSDAYTIGVGGLWTDSFTVVQDSCYSGNAVPKHQAEAYIPGSREQANGWIASSAQADEPCWTEDDGTGTSVFTNALIACLKAGTPSGNLKKCIQDNLDAELNPDGLSPPPYSQTAIIEFLTPVTDPQTPFMP